MKLLRRTPEEQKTLFLKMVQDRTAGKTLEEVCKENNIAVQTYRNWQFKFKKDASVKTRKPYTKRKPSLMTVQVPETNIPLVVLMGKSSDIQSILDKINQMGARN